MLVHGMSRHRPLAASGVVLGLVLKLGNMVLVPVVGRRSLPSRVGLGPAQGAMHRPETMGAIGVKDIATPEVKFLDRCQINCSEGVLQVRVRRSRMRVWGAKMIRHRRSPRL